jgi:hypothetical protein
MTTFLRSFFFSTTSLLAACGQTAEEAPPLAKAEQALIPPSIPIEINTRVNGVSVYMAYFHPSVPAGDPGYRLITGINRNSPVTVTIPGNPACVRGITNVATLDGVPQGGTVPQGIELKVIMPNGQAAGISGKTPGDNEVIFLKVNGLTPLAALPYLTYIDNSNRNLFINSWLLGCTP